VAVALVYLQHIGAIANIGHNGHSAEAGDKFAKKFDSLASSVGRLLRQARNIAARSREVRDETSIAGAKTIGMADVVCFAAPAAPPDVTITSTFRRTNSPAISAKRSLRPSAQRYSIVTVRPCRLIDRRV
jgi:hypothetical protein